MEITKKAYPISRIARLRIGSDGKGIRTLVIVGGCPLKCKYCINSFTWDESETAELMDVRTLYEKVCIDRPYLMATNGGITLGGGEPLLYSDLVRELYNECKEDMTIYAETSLNVPMQNVIDSADFIDKYYVDIKSMDEQIYRKYTGGELSRTLDNLSFLVNKKGTDSIVVRIPIIPEFTNHKMQERYKEKLMGMGLVHFDLFTYRT